MRYYIGLGTNLGDKESNIRQALERMTEIGSVIRRSGNFYSEPWGFTSPNSFLNIVFAFETEKDPFELLAYTQQVEKEMGRQAKSLNGIYSDRIIDIDILMYDGEDIHTDTLQIPHPLIWQRDFVKIPLQELLDSI
ncbi:MAG: 2-amino-4-hydroxy-6-hydroxymethyldihydropteridine diphosphokinase [Paludibacteraceae bacterium]|nr:2-amino-4-hydroxy-6-hydroxymethyldihydropteridine diphosphokinase [Paludibacteraceae bacterium]MBO7233567.1 2-amino-4-hydroxy-6-hydroxymethyldihydropteridine diphosphokinase [Paludibacteraceae bacterium]MBO7258690.1 2-amino-4-hydroxy-6-hydroxymethyldihydropteridine diphosphokinase [Paludibacteraceae bacterium]